MNSDVSQKIDLIIDEQKKQRSLIDRLEISLFNAIKRNRKEIEKNRTAIAENKVAINKNRASIEQNTKAVEELTAESKKTNKILKNHEDRISSSERRSPTTAVYE